MSEIESVRSNLGKASRLLSINELRAVSGGTEVCEYEVANRCYVWVEERPTWGDIIRGTIEKLQGIMR